MTEASLGTQGKIAATWVLTGVVAGRAHAAESVPMAALQHGIDRRDHVGVVRVGRKSFMAEHGLHLAVAAEQLGVEVFDHIDPSS